MALDDRQMHLAAAIGTVVLAGALLAPAALLTGAVARADDGPALADMEAIEASLAYKKPSPKAQPQKRTRAPEPEVKPDGVSHDADRAPTPPRDDPKKPEAPDDPLKKYQRHGDDDDAPVGQPTETVGAFDGSEHGFAEESKGDPFFQKLVADLLEGWEYPKILDAAGVPVGCLHVAADGKIVDTKLKEQSGEGSLDESVDKALQKLKKARNEAPEPVPTHLLRAATTRWVCFKFKLDK